MSKDHVIFRHDFYFENVFFSHFVASTPYAQVRLLCGCGVLYSLFEQQISFDDHVCFTHLELVPFTRFLHDYMILHADRDTESGDDV